MDKHNDHLLFLKIVDKGSFHGAATELSTSVSSVSRQLKKIETQLGITLIKRTTRHLSLTEAGSIYYQSCKRIEEELRVTHQRLQDHTAKPVGNLRVTVTRAFSYAQLIRAIKVFSREYPDITFELEVTDQQIDLAETGTDVAIRIGQLKDSRLRSRKLMNSYLIPCASEAYLAEYGAPESLSDITDHHIIATNHLPGIEKQYQALDAGALFDAPRRLIVNDVVSVYRAVKEGIGISFLPEYLISSDLVSGDLIPILGQYPNVLHEVFALYVDSDYLPIKTRVFIDHLAKQFTNF